MGETKDTQKQEATKDYVVAFDQLDVNTGEFADAGPGMHKVAITRSYFRGDTVPLTAADAERHLEFGAVVAADDPRAKLIRPNEARSQGVKRDPEQVLASAYNQGLEEHPSAVAGGEGAKRAPAGKLGSAAELNRLKASDLKALAKEHGVEVTRGMTKPDLVKKLAKVSPAGDGAGSQTDNPGQGKDQSPPEGGVAAEAAAEEADESDGK